MHFTYLINILIASDERVEEWDCERISVTFFVDNFVISLQFDFEFTVVRISYIIVQRVKVPEDTTNKRNNSFLSIFTSFLRIYRFLAKNDQKVDKRDQETDGFLLGKGRPKARKKRGTERETGVFSYILMILLFIFIMMLDRYACKGED